MIPELVFPACRSILADVRDLGTNRWSGEPSNSVAIALSTTRPSWFAYTPGRTRASFVEEEAERASNRVCPELWYWLRARDAFLELIAQPQMGLQSQKMQLALAKTCVPLALMSAGVDLVLDVEIPQDLKDELTKGVGDAHVHAGAIVPFSEVMRFLISEPMDGGEMDSTFAVDGFGTPFNVAVVAAALKVSWKLLEGLARGTLLEDVLATPHINLMVRDGTFWPRVRDACVREDDSAFVSSLVAEASEPHAFPPDNALDAALEGCKNAGGKEQQFVAEVLRSIILLHAAVTPVPGEGLGRFVEKFQAFRSLRRGAGTQRSADGLGNRESQIAAGIAHARKGNYLSRLELRKTEFPGRQYSTDDLRAMLGEHLRGIAAALDADAKLTVQIPLSFDRRGIQSVSRAVSERSSRYDLAPHFKLIDCWEQLASDNPGLAPIFSAFDVAGSEDAYPNWPFALLFDEIQTRATELKLGSTPTFSMHVGESFGTRLEGLRRVGEVFLFKQRPSRLGHALALDTDAATRQAGPCWFALRLRSLEDILDDVLWAVATFGLEVLSAAEKALLSDLCAQAFGSTNVTVQSIIDSYRLRFSREAATVVGLLVPAAMRVSHRQADNSRRSPRGLDAAHSLFWNYLYGIPCNGLSLKFDQKVPDQLIGQCVLMVERLYDLLVQKVLSQVAQECLVETCPTSNATLGYIAGNVHPWQRFCREGINVTINTDDPGLFHNHIIDEYEMLYYSACGEQASELVDSRTNGLAACAKGLNLVSAAEYLVAAERLSPR